MTDKISVVIPVYKAEGVLRELYRRLVDCLESINRDFEIILVEDCGGDGSWDIILELSQEDPRVIGFQHNRNYGQHNAILAGIRAASYDTIVTLDDDLQHPPEEIPKLLEKLAEGNDVVYGVPEREQNGLWRAFASWTIRRILQSIMNTKNARHASAFRAFRTHVRDAFSAYNSPFVSIDVLLSWGTSRFSAVTVRHDPRRVGRSQYTFHKLVAHALDMMTGFSIWPLRFASLIGFGFTFFGICVLIYVFGRYLIEGGSIPGFPFLASIIAIFSGAQLFALGIIGEYLARMHFRSMGRPSGFMRCTTHPSIRIGQKHRSDTVHPGSKEGD
ncbi:MAG: glycosyltransferase family 2 protein [Planctomycetes bacterium]|nr:glycosyltransferase family 2 protein [Planctomycetota bacterium]